jgi:hypothetical protein
MHTTTISDFPLQRSVNTLVKGLFHAPYSTWYEVVSSKRNSRWRISWAIAGRPSFRISGPHCKDIDKLATVLGFGNLSPTQEIQEAALPFLSSLSSQLFCFFQQLSQRDLLKSLSQSMRSKCLNRLHLPNPSILVLLRNFL